MFENVRGESTSTERPTIGTTEIETDMETEMVTKRTDMTYFLVPVLCCRLSLQCAFIRTQANTSIYNIYIYTCVLLCIYMHTAKTTCSKESAQESRTCQYAWSLLRSSFRFPFQSRQWSVGRSVGRSMSSTRVRFQHVPAQCPPEVRSRQRGQSRLCLL